ncbi:unnamed protein product, partial [Brassica rapa subsp. trilocularis]
LGGAGHQLNLITAGSVMVATASSSTPNIGDIDEKAITKENPEIVVVAFAEAAKIFSHLIKQQQKPTRKKKAPNSTFKDYFVILNHVCGK